MNKEIPAHVAPVGTILPHDYFLPGTFEMDGKVTGSPWVIAYFQGEEFRYERAALGEPWVRVANISA